MTREAWNSLTETQRNTLTIYKTDYQKYDHEAKENKVYNAWIWRDEVKFRIHGYLKALMDSKQITQVQFRELYCYLTL